MSDSERSPRATTATLIPQFVNDAIKDVFGSFKCYCDYSTLKIKEDSEKKLSEASSKCSISFCFKVNNTCGSYRSSLLQLKLGAPHEYSVRMY